MVLAMHDGRIYMERRPPVGIWGGLWSFPEIEPDAIDDWSARELAVRAVNKTNLEPLRHSFSHYDLDIHPVLVHADSVSSTVADSTDKAWFAVDAKPPGGIAAPVSKLIQQLNER